MAHIYVQIKTEDDPLTDVGGIIWETDFNVPEKTVESFKDLLARIKGFLENQKERKST